MNPIMAVMAVLPLDFQGLMGVVKSSDVIASLWLMLKGMVGIFIVMLIIFAVVAILSKVTGKKKDEEQQDG